MQSNVLLLLLLMRYEEGPLVWSGKDGAAQDIASFSLINGCPEQQFDEQCSSCPGIE